MAQHFILLLWGIMASLGTLIILYTSAKNLKIQRELDIREGLKRTSIIAMVILGLVSIIWLGALWWSILTI